MMIVKSFMQTELPNLNAALIDSNILLYAHDQNEPAKQAIAKALLRKLTDSQTLALSVQTLNEFYNAARRPKRGFNLTHDQIVTILGDIAESATVYDLSSETAFLAYDAITLYGFSLIWAVAKENGIGIIYTEDGQSAEVIEGVRCINPFAANMEAKP